TASAGSERVRAMRRLISETDLAEMSGVRGGLREEVSQVLEADPSDVVFQHAADIWHRGQEYALEVAFSDEDARREDFMSLLSERFLSVYQETYRRPGEGENAEIVRIRTIGRLPQ